MMKRDGPTVTASAARRGRARFMRAKSLYPDPPARVQPAGSAPAPIHAAESAAVAGGAAGAAAAAAATRASPLAALLSGPVLRGGGVVLLVLNPSLWFILFQSIRFVAAVILVLLSARVFGDRRQIVHGLAYFETGAFLIGGRLMFAVVQWMRRLYVLTDQRVIRLAGVFS